MIHTAGPRPLSSCQNVVGKKAPREWPVSHFVALYCLVCSNLFLFLIGSILLQIISII